MALSLGSHCRGEPRARVLFLRVPEKTAHETAERRKSRDRHESWQGKERGRKKEEARAEAKWVARRGAGRHTVLICQPSLLARASRISDTSVGKHASSQPIPIVLPRSRHICWKRNWKSGGLFCNNRVRGKIIYRQCCRCWLLTC